jgi:cysteine sulfinate desulfinase/cysteine desulfurase-like protein
MLTDAVGVLALSSGMVAIANVVLALAEAGSHIVASNYLFGNTYSLFEQTLRAWGMSVSYVDMTRPADVAAALGPQTRLVFLEVITNPQLQVPDVRAVVEAVQLRGVPVVVDGTMTSVSLFHSKDSGAAVEVVSSTKAISGGATSTGGLIVDNGTFPVAAESETAAVGQAVRPVGLAHVSAAGDLPQLRLLPRSAQRLSATAGAGNARTSHAQELRQCLSGSQLVAAIAQGRAGRLSGVGEFAAPRGGQGPVPRRIRQPLDLPTAKPRGMFPLHGSLPGDPPGNERA